jgi:hypothetical protein
VVAATVVAFIAITVPAEAATTRADLAADAAWIETTVVPSGAITLQTDRQAVWPYVANYAALGLAAQAARTGDASALSAAWAQVDWFAAAEGPDGVVTDYSVAPDLTLISMGTEDSTDAYAGTFLTAVAATYNATPSASRHVHLAAIAPGLDGALRAIEATQDSDGMTWAKPSYHVKYLMDQAETYSGLKAAARLFSILGDGARASRAQADAQAMAIGVATLYDSSTGTYRWAKHGDGVEQPADLTNFYPDAMEQVWAVAAGLVPGRVAKRLMASVLAAQPNIGNPGATINTVRGPSQVGYWPWAAKAFLAVGNSAEGDALTTSNGTYARANGRVWPFTTGNAGQILATVR